MEITNEMIYRKLEQMDQKFAQIDEHFIKSYGRIQNLEMRMEMIATQLRDFKAETNRRFEQMDKSFERIEAMQTEDHRILMNLWEHKDHMKLDLTRTLLTVTGTLSFVVAFIVSFITGKAIIYKS